MPNRPKSDEQKTIEKIHSMVYGIYENTELEYDVLMHHELIDNLKSISIKVETILEFLDLASAVMVLFSSSKSSKTMRSYLLCSFAPPLIPEIFDFEMSLHPFFNSMSDSVHFNPFWFPK